jgi:hypothetical protein
MARHDQRETLLQALQFESSSPAESLRILNGIRRRYSAELKSSESAREMFLEELGFTHAELRDWKSALKVCRERLQMVRPAGRSTASFVFLVAQFLAAARRVVKPTPYLCELLDQVRYVEDIAVEPAAAVALWEMVRLPDYQLCGKAIYIFKKVSRRYDMPELKFTRAAVDQLVSAYVKRYVIEADVL